MNDLIGLIIMATDLLGNFTSNPFQSMTSPYIGLLGEFFYGFIMLGVTGIIYRGTTGEGNTRMVTIAIWLLAATTVGSVIFHSTLIMVIGIISSIVVGGIMYKGLIAKEEY